MPLSYFNIDLLRDQYSYLPAMEVHPHHQSHGPKKFREYFFEFFMIFLAVTAGFFAETIREHISERNKEKEYMRSLITDVKEDTSQMNDTFHSLFNHIKGQDSLIDLLSNFKENDSSSMLAYKYYLKYTIGVPEVLFSERTMTQLLNSGNLRLINKQNISDSIINYYDLIKENKLQLDYYTEIYKKTFEYSYNIFDFSRAKNPMHEDFTYSNPRIFNGKPLRLMTKDSFVLKKYCSYLTTVQGVTGIYIYSLKRTNEAAGRLLAILKKEYEN